MTSYFEIKIANYAELEDAPVIFIRGTIKGSAFSIKMSTKHNLPLYQKHCKTLHYNHQTKL